MISFILRTYTVTWTDEKDLHEVATVNEQTSYTITGLTLDTVYTIHVTAANWCGNGPEFRTSVSLSTDPTVTASSNRMTITSTVNPISTTSTAAVTSYNVTTTISVTTITVTLMVNSSTDIPIAITYPSITTITDIVDPPIPTDTSETCKFLTSKFVT